MKPEQAAALTIDRFESGAIVTWLFLKPIAARARSDEDWPAFRARNADLVDEFPRSRVA